MDFENTKNIAKTTYGYKILCECGEDTHNIDISVDNNSIYISGYFKCMNDEEDGNFLVRFWKKLCWKVKVIYNILFRGYIEEYRELIFVDKKHIDSMIYVFSKIKEKYY